MGKTTIVCLLLLLCTSVGWTQDFGLVPYRVKEKWGFADSLGTIKIKPKYEDVIPFNEGYAAYKKNGKWGFINKKGKELIAPQYDSIDMYLRIFLVDDTVNKKTLEIPGALVYVKGERMSVNLQGKKLGVDYVTVDDDSYDDVMIGYYKPPLVKIINENGRYGFINIEQKQQYEPVYDSLIYIESSIYSFLLARKNGLWGIIDSDNQTLIDFQYEDMRSQYRNVLYPLAKKNGLWGIIDMQNQLVLNFEYDNIELIIADDCNLYYYIVVKGNRYKLIESNYKDRFPSSFYVNITPDAKADNCGLYFTTEDGNVGYYNVYNGRIVVQPYYKWIDFDFKSKFLLFKENDLYGYEIVNEGIKVDAKYKSIVPFKVEKEYTTVITVNNKKGYINRKGFEFFED